MNGENHEGFRNVHNGVYSRGNLEERKAVKESQSVNDVRSGRMNVSCSSPRGMGFSMDIVCNPSGWGEEFATKDATTVEEYKKMR